MAIAGGAPYVVSADKGVLAVGAHAGVRTVSPREFLELHP
jgi:hypothetical protein